MKSNITRILVVEDHTLVRKGLCSLINLEPSLQVVGEAADGLQAVQMAEEVNPDIIIMDIGLPKLNGIEASRQILKINSTKKILILSAHSDDGHIERLSALGVSGYLAKQCSPKYLIQAIQDIMNGKTIYSPNITERRKSILQSQINSKGKNVNNKSTLSEREAQVLQLVAEGNANKQIADQLKISIKTVEKHRQNLMKKLALHDTAGLTRYAISEGYIENSTTSHN
jgi:DNA-binding NarL/FixJ family response regulator